MTNRYFKVVRVNKDWHNYVQELEAFIGEILKFHSDQDEEGYRLYDPIEDELWDFEPCGLEEVLPFSEAIEHKDGDVCLYGDRQVVIIGEPNKEEQSAQVVDFNQKIGGFGGQETVRLKDLGMVLWNRFDELPPKDKEEQESPANKYMREIKPGVWVDVYDVLHAFVVTNPALQHLIKKALAVGQRGHKDASEDYQDIIDSSVRAKQLHEEWNEQ